MMNRNQIWTQTDRQYTITVTRNASIAPSKITQYSKNSCRSAPRNIVASLDTSIRLKEINELSLIDPPDMDEVAWEMHLKKWPRPVFNWLESEKRYEINPVALTWAQNTSIILRLNIGRSSDGIFFNELLLLVPIRYGCSRISMIIWTLLTALRKRWTRKCVLHRKCVYLAPFYHELYPARSPERVSGVSLLMTFLRY